MPLSILIDVRNLQLQDGEQNIIHYKTRGYLYQKGQATYLQYQEGAEGLEGVQTTLKIEKDRVTLIRHGELSMNQVFKSGTMTEGIYRTPWGQFDMGTETTNIEMALGFEEGRFRIFYKLYLGGELTSENTLELTYHSTGEEEE